MYIGIDKYHPVIAWWSGGAASAVTCRLCIDWFGKENVVIVFIGTRNEDDDTERFRLDCERWFELPIQTITNKNYENIKEVWYKFMSLNSATGAICSSELKRTVRQDFQNKNCFSFQAFGFDTTEINRAKQMKRNYPDSKPIFPLIYELLDKKETLKIISKAGIELPNSYKLGYSNNNCLKTGCVQGGIGYWQKYQNDFPDRFEKMAAIEHDLTNIKGEPVTICKDQSNEAKKRNGGKAELVFLLPHPNYPLMKDISMIKGRQPESLMECNGFCNHEKNNFNNQVHHLNKY